MLLINIFSQIKRFEDLGGSLEDFNVTYIFKDFTVLCKRLHSAEKLVHHLHWTTFICRAFLFIYFF